MEILNACCEEWKDKFTQAESSSAILQGNVQMLKAKIIDTSLLLNQYRQLQDKLKKATEEVVELKKLNGGLSHELSVEKVETASLRQQIEHMFEANKPTLLELERVKAELAKTSDTLKSTEAYVVQLEATAKEGKEARDNYATVKNNVAELRKDLSSNEAKYKDVLRRSKHQQFQVNTLTEEVEKLKASLETANNTILSLELESGLSRKDDDITWESVEPGPVESFDDFSKDLEGVLEASTNIEIDPPAVTDKSMIKAVEKSLARISATDPSDGASKASLKKHGSRDDEVFFISSSPSSPSVPPPAPAESSPRRRRAPASVPEPQPLPVVKPLAPPATPNLSVLLSKFAAAATASQNGRSVPSPQPSPTHSPRVSTLPSFLLPAPTPQVAWKPQVTQKITTSATEPSPPSIVPTKPSEEPAMVVETKQGQWEKPMEVEKQQDDQWENVEWEDGGGSWEHSDVLEEDAIKKPAIEIATEMPQQVVEDVKKEAEKAAQEKAQEAREREAREQEELDKLAREAREREAREAREKEARERAAKEKEARENREREKLAKEAKEKVDRELREREAREREKEAREKEAREREIRQREAKEQAERREREAKEAREKEAEAREKAAREAKAREAREKEAKEKAAREAREREERAKARRLEQEARDKLAKEQLEKEARDRKRREQEARDKLEQETREREAHEKAVREKVKQIEAANTQISEQQSTHSENLVPRESSIESLEEGEISSDDASASDSASMVSGASHFYDDLASTISSDVGSTLSRDDVSIVSGFDDGASTCSTASFASHLEGDEGEWEEFDEEEGRILTDVKQEVLDRSPMHPSPSPPSISLSPSTSLPISPVSSPPLNLPAAQQGNKMKEMMQKHKKQKKRTPVVYNSLLGSLVSPSLSPTSPVISPDLSPPPPIARGASKRKRVDKANQQNKKIHLEEEGELKEEEGEVFEDDLTVSCAQHPIVSSFIFGISQSVELEPPLSPSLLPEDPLDSVWEVNKAQNTKEPLFNYLCRRFILVFSPPSPAYAISSLYSCDDLVSNFSSVISLNLDVVVNAFLKVLHDCNSKSKVDTAVALFWQIYGASDKASEFRALCLSKISHSILTSQSFASIAYLCELYPLVCKSTSDLDKVLFLAYEVVRQNALWKIQILSHLALWWPDPFIAKAENNKLILLVIEVIVAVSSADQSNPQFLKEREAYDVLRKTCYWPFRAKPEVTLLAGVVPDLIQGLIQSVQDPVVEPHALFPLRTNIVFKAFELISLYKGSTWTYDELVMKLWGVMASSQASSHPSIISAVVRLIGKLSVVLEKDAVEAMIAKVGMILNPNSVERFKFTFLTQTCAALSLVELSRGDRQYTAACKAWYSGLTYERKCEIAHHHHLVEHCTN